MSEILELEYRGLNIFDEISTVEVAIDESHKVIHIYDCNQVVEPEYNFTAKQYQMSEGYFKMANVLYDKKFYESNYQTLKEWIMGITWIFYGSKKSIIKYQEGIITEIPKENNKVTKSNSIELLYKKYLMRVL